MPTMLKGERITLRAVERADLPALWQSANDLEIELLSGGDPPLPHSLAAIEKSFETRTADDKDSPCLFGIEVDGKLIGICDLRDFDHQARCCSLGIIIFERDYWGRGFGRESVELLAEYGFNHHNLHRIWLDAHATNERALRCYRACGFVEEGLLREHDWSNGSYVDLVMMGLLRSEWLVTEPAFRQRS